MTILLRHLRKPQKWVLDPSSLTWLASGDVPADPLVNLETEENALSVYAVGDNLPDEAMIERVAAAMRVGSSADRLDHFEYIYFSKDVLVNAGIDVEAITGRTKDDVVNGWHRDLVRISVGRLAALAHELIPKADKDMVTADRIRELVADWVVEERLTIDDIQWGRKEKQRLKFEVETRRSSAGR